MRYLTTLATSQARAPRCARPATAPNRNGADRVRAESASCHEVSPSAPKTQCNGGWGRRRAEWAIDRDTRLTSSRRSEIPKHCPTRSCRGNGFARLRWTCSTFSPDPILSTIWPRSNVKMGEFPCDFGQKADCVGLPRETPTCIVAPKASHETRSPVTRTSQRCFGVVPHP